MKMYQILNENGQPLYVFLRYASALKQVKKTWPNGYEEPISDDYFSWNTNTTTFGIVDIMCFNLKW